MVDRIQMIPIISELEIEQYRSSIIDSIGSNLSSNQFRILSTVLNSIEFGDLVKLEFQVHDSELMIYWPEWIHDDDCAGWFVISSVGHITAIQYYFDIEVQINEDELIDVLSKIISKCSIKISPNEFRERYNEFYNEWSILLDDQFS